MMLKDQGNKCFGCIYLIENIQNRKIYIGKTINFKKRMEDHFRNALENRDNNKNGKYLYNAIRKYGKQNFKCRILGYCNSKEELNEAEKECIYFYRSFGSDGLQRDSIYGYNMTKGGDGGDTFTGNYHSQETKNKISIGNKGKHIGYKPSNETIQKLKNRKPSEETRKKMSIALSGKNNPFFGKKHSEETKNKISKANKNKEAAIKGKTFEEFYGKKEADKKKKKLSDSHIGKISSKKGKTFEELYGLEKAKELKKQHRIKMTGKKSLLRNIPREKEVKEKISKTLIGSKWMNNSEQIELVKQNKIQEYLKNGWVFGKKCQ